MSTLTPQSIDAQVREVTDAEVTAYQEQGWVELPGLVSPELAGELLTHIKAVTGLHYDRLPQGHPDAELVMRRIRDRGIYKIFAFPRFQDDLAWQIVTSRALGAASARLTGTRPMRLLLDGVILKLPAWTEEAMNLGGGLGATWSGETPWHQDYTVIPWDRRGGVQFWLALSEITPEMGSMQHLTGSHREGPLGGPHLNQDQTAKINGDQTLRGTRPELWDKYEVSPPHHFQPGDVLAHDSLTLHYAQANRTDRLRWVYTSYRVPADTLYNGIPFRRFDEVGVSFEQWKPFEHPRFPIVAS